MELTDQRDISAPPDVVWSALVDADVLQRCIPGCQEMSGNPDDGYDAVVTQKVGPVKATFKGHVTLSNVVPGQSCTISGEGKGGPAGFAKGGADVVLTPTGEGTRLSYDVTAKVGGKLAQLGSRIIDGFSKKMADQFFDNFKSVVEGDNAPAEVSPAVAESQAAEPAASARGAPAPTAGRDEPSVAAASPDEPQTGEHNSGEHKKGWFRRLMS